MSWGYRILLLYLGFVALIVTLVFASTQQEFQLEVKDYYGKEKEVNDHLQRVNNSRNLQQQVQISYDAGARGINIRFPEAMEGISGQVQLFRPSDSRLDRFVTLSAGDRQLIPADDMLHGLWRVRINWSAGGVNYYDEAPLNLP